MSDNNQPELGSPIITSITADAPIPTEGAAKAGLGPDDKTRMLSYQVEDKVGPDGQVKRTFPAVVNPEAAERVSEAIEKLAVQGPKRIDLPAPAVTTPQQVETKAMQSLSTEPNQVLNEKEWSDLKGQIKPGTASVPAPQVLPNTAPIRKEDLTTVLTHDTSKIDAARAAVIKKDQSIWSKVRSHLPFVNKKAS
jgi:hypothetical protein